MQQENLWRAVQELENYPYDSTARQDALYAIVAFLRSHHFSCEVIQIIWNFQEKDNPTETPTNPA